MFTIVPAGGADGETYADVDIQPNGTINLINARENLTVIGTLPVAARPTRDIYTIVHTFDGTYADLVIQTNGEIVNIDPRSPVVTDLSFLSLEGITYDAPSPKFFGLGLHGTEQQGATVTAMLSRPRALALLVSVARSGRLVNVGVVHLGSHRAGLSYIHWNLVVNKRVLPAGRYELSLHALNGALLSVPASPGARTLVVQANGHIHTQ